jgi:trehalose/maltose hydrolase-like predicted phosphorylase
VNENIGRPRFPANLLRTWHVIGTNAPRTDQSIRMAESHKNIDIAMRMDQYRNLLSDDWPKRFMEVAHNARR